MKHLKLMAVCLAGFAFMQAEAAEQGDTLVFEQVDKVRIETRDTIQRITITGMKDEPDMQYVQRISIPDTSAVRRQMRNIKDFNKIVIPRRDGKPSKWSSSLHANFGLGMLTGHGDMDVMRGVAWEIGMAVTADWNPFGKQNTWSVGFGIDYRTFKAPKDLYWTKNAGPMQFAPFSAAQENHDASLSITSLQLPFFYTHKFDQRGRWSVALGALLNLNFGRIHRNYEVDCEDYDVDAAARGVRLFTVEGMAIVDTPILPSLYVRYAPMTVFKENKGPKMHMLTFGICI